MSTAITPHTIRELRNANGLSRRQLAAQLDASPRTIEHWENLAKPRPPHRMFLPKLKRLMSRVKISSK